MWGGGERGGWGVCRVLAYAALMGIVITVTVIFSLITLIGTYLSRRSAYQWADNERDLAASVRPIDWSAAEQSGTDPNQMAGQAPGVVARPAGYTSPVRTAARPSQVVVSGFETSSDAHGAADASSPKGDPPPAPSRTPTST